jgi:hypothetical protein
MFLTVKSSVLFARSALFRASAGFLDWHEKTSADARKFRDDILKILSPQLETLAPVGALTVCPFRQRVSLVVERLSPGFRWLGLFSFGRSR